MATTALPKWVMHRYSLLWRTTGERDFDFGRAAKILKEKDFALLSVVLSELKKHGWLTIKLNPKDSRKRFYTLVNPEDAVEAICKNV